MFQVWKTHIYIYIVDHFLGDMVPIFLSGRSSLNTLLETNHGREIPMCT